MVVIDRLTGKKEAKFLTHEPSRVKVVRLDSEKDCVFAKTNIEVQKELEAFFAREKD
jgi:hypothetical protein